MSTVQAMFPIVPAVLCLVAVVLLLARPVSVRDHLVTLAILCGLCLLTANNMIVMLSVFLTFGIVTFVIFILVNVAFYYALALPGVAYAQRLAMQGVAWWLTVLALPVAAAFVVPPASHTALQSTRAAELDGDITATLPRSAGLVTIQDEFFRSHSATPTYKTECTVLCQRLLAQGYAERVRIVSKDKKKRALTGSEFSLARTAHCPDVLSKHAPPIPEILTARAEGLCVVKDIAAPEAAGLIIVHQVTDARPHHQPFALVPRPYIDRISIQSMATDGTATTLWRTTRLKTEPLGLPLALVPELNMHGSRDFPWGFWRTPSRNQIDDWADVTVSALISGNASPSSLAAQPDERELRQNAIVRLLDSDAPGPFPDSVTQAVIAWTMGSPRPREKSEVTEDILLRLAADRRFTDISQVFFALGDRPAVLIRAVPSLMDRLENPPAAVIEAAKKKGHYDFDRANIAYTLLKLPDAHLAPLTPRLVRIVETNTGSWTAGLVALLGRLPGDHSALIRSRLAADLPVQVRDRAAQAACQSPLGVLSALRDDLMSALQSSMTEKGGRDRVRHLAAPLIRLGERDGVVQILGGENAPEMRYLKHRGKLLESGFPPDQCPR